MIIGTGIDIVEVKRLQKVLLRQERFPDRILTGRERDVFETMNERRQLEFLSGRFAAKEAYSKAKGCGIGKQLSFRDIEVINDENGRPAIRVQDDAYVHVHLSISHTKDYAAAQVIIESSSS